MALITVKKTRLYSAR